MEFMDGLILVLLMTFASKVTQVSTDDHYIDPSVRLVSCLTGKIVLKITDSQTDGVMYIKDENTVYNMQLTENEYTIYVCDSAEVSIQTSHDVKLIFTCVWDQSDIVPNKDTNKDSDSENTQFYIYTATASMSFYNTDGEQIVAGSYIKLGTDVTMKMKLVNTHDGLLDINVKSCNAAEIGIITDRCPLDEDLFDSFNKTSVGVVENIFQMFRTTSSNPEPVSMLFSCLLEVCYAPCIEYVCNGTDAIPETSRQKRQIQEPGQVARSMTVGSLFKVGLEDPVLIKEENAENCVALPVFIACIALFGFLLFLTLSALLYYWREWKKIKVKLSSNSEAGDSVQDCWKDVSASPYREGKTAKEMAAEVKCNVNGTNLYKEAEQISKISGRSVKAKTTMTGTGKKDYMNIVDSSLKKTFQIMKHTQANTTAKQKVIIKPDQLVRCHKMNSSYSESSRSTDFKNVKVIPSLIVQSKIVDSNSLHINWASATNMSSPGSGINKTEPPWIKPAKKVSFLMENNSSPNEGIADDLENCKVTAEGVKVIADIQQQEQTLQGTASTDLEKPFLTNKSTSPKFTVPADKDGLLLNNLNALKQAYM